MRKWKLPKITIKESHWKTMGLALLLPLLGIVFVNTDDVGLEGSYEELTTLSDPASDTGTPEPSPLMLKVLYWNARNIGKRYKDYDRVASVLADGDIVALYELEIEDQGRGALHVVADLVQKRNNEKICRAWFRNRSNGREKLAILWKESTIAWVEPGGEMKETCGDAAIPLQRDPSNPSVFTTTMFSKIQKRMFVFATMNLPGDLKDPNAEISRTFRGLVGQPWPVVVVGDFKIPSRHEAFKIIRSNGFKAAMSGKSSVPGKKSLDNFWYKNGTVAHASTVNLYRRFSELKPHEIDKKVAENFPIFAEFALSVEAKEAVPTITLQRVQREKAIARARKDAQKQAALEAKKAQAASKPKPFQDFKEDLEAEANDAEVATRIPTSVGAKKTSGKSATSSKASTPSKSKKRSNKSPRK